jgi:hypothetical protein
MAPRFILSLLTPLLLIWNISFIYANNDTISIPKVGYENYESLIKNIVKESTSYQEFKLIKKSDLDILNTAYKVEEASFKNAIIELQNKINVLELGTTDLINQNQELQKKYNSVVTSSKDSSTKMFIIIISTLLLILIYFVYRFNSLSHTYNDHKNAILAVESEFEEYKRNAIEREQKIKRELINAKNALNGNAQKKSNVNTEKIEQDIPDKKVIKKIDLDELLSKGIDSINTSDKEVKPSIKNKTEQTNANNRTASNVRKLELIKNDTVNKNIVNKRKG